MVQREYNNHNQFPITGWAPTNEDQEQTTQQLDDEHSQWMVQCELNQPNENYIIQQLQSQ